MIRSCRRGLGPAKRCEGLVLEAMPALPAEPSSWNPNGPWRPRASLVLGSWWFLREVEFSTAELRSLRINAWNSTASLTLPASKADPSALGQTISHGCCCMPADPKHRGSRPSHQSRGPCPYHLALDHMAAYARQYPDRFDGAGWPRAGYPLFPGQSGAVCTKTGVAATIRHAAELLGQPTKDPGGLFLHSGHALRVTGA